jgi:branched-chain amino acid aminotransferase
MAIAFLDGQFISLDDARISALDAGVQHAAGLFETMLGGCEPSVFVIDLDRHMQSLVASAHELGLSSQLREQPLGEAVLETVRRSGLARARIRLTITGGDLNLLARGAAPGERRQSRPSLLIVAQPATVYPAGMLERGVLACLADSKANPFNPMESHKTLNYWWRLRELQIAATKQAGEALIFDVTSHLVGGCVSNAFIVKDGQVRTPIARGEEGFGPSGPQGTLEEKPAKGLHLPSPVRPGVTRQWVCDQLELLGSPVQRQMLTIHDVLAADELFLTNSSWGVLPVVQVESHAIGPARSGEHSAPGPVAEALMAQWAKYSHLLDAPEI